MQTNEAQEQAATALEQTESTASKTQELERKIGSLHEQLAALQRTVQLLAGSRPSDEAQVPQGLQDSLKDWLRKEIKVGMRCLVVH